MIFVFSFIVVAAPPSLENHQFYGEVHWDVGAQPEEVVASVNGESFSTAVEAPDYCGENTCTGKDQSCSRMNVDISAL